MTAEFLGHPFAKPELLERALTHSSYANEHPGVVSNERLEFLGDAVLGLLLAHHLYERLPDRREDHLTLVRKYFVSASGLFEPAQRLGLAKHLRLGRGAQRELDAGDWSDTPLSSAVEALLGAVYLDAGAAQRGLAAANEVARKLWADTWEKVDELDEGSLLDPIQRLYLRFQARYKQDPSLSYTPLKPGEHPAHFEAVIRHAEQEFGRGFGSSKQRAKRRACAAALANWPELS